MFQVNLAILTDRDICNLEASVPFQPLARVQHSVVLDSDATCATQTLAQGKSGAITFIAPGTYAYHCGIHGNAMKGSITVSA